MTTFNAIPDRPRLTASALRSWLPPFLRRFPYLVTAYVVPGRVSPRLREATMLGVTSVSRCAACGRVHQRWARATGLAPDDIGIIGSIDSAGYAYGQALAARGPHHVNPPQSLSGRHRRELEAAGFTMQLANLAGNRFLPVPEGISRLQIGGMLAARTYDLAMRLADRLGLRRARRRITAGAHGDVLEIGIGTGLNLAGYPPGASLQGIDQSESALAIADRRARRQGLRVILTAGDAAALPYAAAAFDVVVGTFVLCSVGDVPSTLSEIRRVLRVGGTVRLLEHVRSNVGPIASGQRRLAPMWARLAGGCRLDQDVRAALEQAGFDVTEQRSQAGGALVEVVAVDRTR